MRSVVEKSLAHCAGFVWPRREEKAAEHRPSPEKVRGRQPDLESFSPGCGTLQYPASFFLEQTHHDRARHA